MAGGNSLEGREQKKGIAINTLYTMGGLLFMNAVLQIVITPLLNRMMGAEQLGGLLYITGLVAIICPSIGQALNNSRLVVRRDFDVTNGDYDWLLLGFGLIGSIVALFMSGKSLESPLMAAGVFLMFMLTVFRYYGDVEYRLNLNYRRYFIYYFLIGIGYLAGFGIYRLTGQWVLIYLIGGVLGNVISLLIELRTQDFAVSAGASGAVFAVMGAMIYIVIRNKGWLGDLSMRQILVMAAFSLYFGFASTGVDNTAHVGGMVSGFCLAVIFYHPGRKI